jgi:hypothetical protein
MKTVRLGSPLLFWLRRIVLPIIRPAAFEASAGKFLAVTFPDRVVVSVRFHTNEEE